MKKAIALVLLIAPIFAFCQKDFDYTLTFSKRTTFNIVAKNKADTLTKSADYSVIKKGNTLTVYSGGGPNEAYHLIFRGVQNGAIGYISGWRDIVVAPLEPFLRIADGEQVIVFQ